MRFSCSAEHASKGFTIVIDNRQGYWREPSTLFDIIQQCLNGNVHSVFVIRADQILDAQRLDLSFRRGKVQTSFKVKDISAQIYYVDFKYCCFDSDDV